jgi:hypothetical protein
MRFQLAVSASNIIRSEKPSLPTLANLDIPKIDPINTRAEVAKIANVSKAQSKTVDRCAPLWGGFKKRMWARVIPNSV